MTLTVIVADDEPLERQGIRQILEGSRYSVIGEAKNGIELVDLCRSLRPDIVIVDIKMPGMDGFTAVEEVRKFLPAVGVVILTAYDEFEYAQEALKLGACDFVLKPARPKEIVGALDRAAELIEAERSKLEEQKRLREQLRSFVPFARIGLAHALLDGTVSNVRYLMDQAESLGMHPFPSVVMVVDIDGFGDHVRDRDELSKQVLKQQVWEAVRGVVEGYPGSIVVPTYDDEFVVLLSLPPSEKPGDEGKVETSTCIAQQVRAAVESSTNVTVVVGVGFPASEPQHLSRSYREAALACRIGSFFMGPNRVVHCRDVQPLISSGASAEAERSLIEHIREGNGQEAEASFLELLETLFDQVGAAVERVKARLLEALIMVGRAAEEAGVAPEDVASCNVDMTCQLMSCQNREHLEAWCREVAREYVAKVGELHRSRPSQAIGRALRYIEKHYARDLSVQELAKVVFLHPDYFSRAFKKQTGMSFVEYRTRVRIEKAKVLLLREDLAVAEVAERVGFSDPNYFSRVFSRLEGKPPREWRREALGGQRVQQIQLRDVTPQVNRR